MVEDGVGLFELLLRFGFDPFTQPKAQAIEHLGHRTGRGPLVLAIALGSQGRQSGLDGQPRIGQARAKRWVLLRMRVSSVVKGLGHLRRRVFPAFTAAESCLRRVRFPMSFGSRPQTCWAKSPKGTRSGVIANVVCTSRP